MAKRDNGYQNSVSKQSRRCLSLTYSRPFQSFLKSVWLLFGCLFVARLCVAMSKRIENSQVEKIGYQSAKSTRLDRSSVSLRWVSWESDKWVDDTKLIRKRRGYIYWSLTDI